MIHFFIAEWYQDAEHRFVSILPDGILRSLFLLC